MTVKTKDWIMPALFLALPFAFMAPGLIWKSQLLFFIICPIFIIALNIKNVWVKAFLLYVAVWQIALLLLLFNFKDASIGPSLSILFSVMAGAIIYKFISESTIPDEKWHMVIRIAVITQIIIATPQHFGLNPFVWIVGMFTPIVEKLPGHLVGTLGNRNYLAAFIAFSVPFFVGWRTFNIGKWTINPSLIVIFIFLGFCLSPGTLAAIMGMGFLLSYKFSFMKRMVTWSAAMKVATAYAAAYILTTGYHLNEFQALPGQLREMWETGKITLSPIQGDIGRFAMWMTAISQLLSSWPAMIFGFGPAAAWGREYPIHGQYVSVWFQYGLIGLTLMLGYICSTIWFLNKGKHVILLTAVIIICLDMVANFPAEIATTSFMMLVICGLIERERLRGGMR
ncbi:MAG TPA: hypothetical protein VLH56_17240 [Dissulfurispiraceae bacterium]|nr:hypothetical protein [Dissulfurispiraceae bacterium]